MIEVSNIATGIEDLKTGADLGVFLMKSSSECVKKDLDKTVEILQKAFK